MVGSRKGFNQLDGVLGLIALFITLEPILGAGSKNLNQRLDVARVSFGWMSCKKKPYKTPPYRQTPY
jgi:hypothetical protein